MRGARGTKVKESVSASFDPRLSGFRPVMWTRFSANGCNTWQHEKEEGLKTFQRYMTNPLCFTRSGVCIWHYPGLILPLTVHIMARTEHCWALFAFALLHSKAERPLLIRRILSPRQYWGFPPPETELYPHLPPQQQQQQQVRTTRWALATWESRQGKNPPTTDGGGDVGQLSTPAAAAGVSTRRPRPGVARRLFMGNAAAV